METKIKFRCWNKKRKEMVYGVDVYNGGYAFEGNKDNSSDFDQTTLEMLTGFDKNGKEVYKSVKEIIKLINQII